MSVPYDRSEYPIFTPSKFLFVERFLSIYAPCSLCSLHAYVYVCIPCLHPLFMKHLCRGRHGHKYKKLEEFQKAQAEKKNDAMVVKL